MLTRKKTAGLTVELLSRRSARLTIPLVQLGQNDRLGRQLVASQQLQQRFIVKQSSDDPAMVILGDLELIQRTMCLFFKQVEFCFVFFSSSLLNLHPLQLFLVRLSLPPLPSFPFKLSFRSFKLGLR